MGVDGLDHVHICGYIPVAEFEWWEPKRLVVLQEQGLDFIRASALFQEDRLYTYESPRGGEERWVSVGRLNGKVVAAVWMLREGTIRIITMRRAHRAEERRFGSLYG
jgi:uncharacterized protein